MRNCFTLFFICCFTVSFAQTEWCPAGAKWAYSVDGYTGLCGYGGYRYFFYEKDTTLGAQPCKILSRKDTMAYCNYGYGVYYSSFSAAPLYTYSSGDTVYFYYEGTRYKGQYSYAGFLPVFCFNAQLGDTLFWDGENYIGYPFEDYEGDFIAQVVDSIGTVQINNDTLRFYRTEIVMDDYCGYQPGYQTSFVIEKFGDTRGYIIPMLDYRCLDGEYSWFCSYQDDSFTIYPESKNCHLSYSGISELSTLSFRISPNPASDFLHIETAENGELQAEIFDLSGRKVLGTNGKSNTIDVRALSLGTYQLKITSARGAGMRLWVKE